MAVPAKKRGSRRRHRVFDGRGEAVWTLVMDDPPAEFRLVHAETVRDALRLQDSVAEFKQMSDDIHDRLAAWAYEHKDRLTGVYTTVRDGSLTFVVVQRARPYDFELEDSLTDLDLELARDFLDFPFAVLQLPLCEDVELQSFLSDRSTMSLQLA